MENCNFTVPRYLVPTGYLVQGNRLEILGSSHQTEMAKSHISFTRHIVGKHSKCPEGASIFQNSIVDPLSDFKEGFGFAPCK